MNIECLSLGLMEANCYIVDDGTTCVLIDPADSADFILEIITRRNLKLLGMVATHGHFDHVMAVGEIQLSCDIPLFVHKRDDFLLKRINETAKHFLGFDPHALEPTNIEYLEMGNFKIGNFEFEVIETPGHTPGSCSFYFQKEEIIFTGDTLFKDGIGRYDFSYSSKVDLDKSLQRLFKLPQDTVVYSGHGEVTTIGEEQELT